MERRCIFCDKPANSSEEVWPRWLTHRFQAPGAMFAQPGLNAPPSSWRVRRPELRLRRVCVECNNGWMSRLENRVKAVLSRLLDQESCTLNSHDRLSLALWAVKTSMVLEALNSSENWRYSDLERCLLHIHETIPIHTYVWIARAVEFGSVYTMSRNLSTQAEIDVDRQVRGGVTTMAFGSIAIQVRKIAIPAAISWVEQITVEERKGPWEQAAMQVWPSNGRSLSWPPSIGLRGEQGLDLFAERFSPPYS